MYETCLSEAERLLAAHKEILVPVKELWSEVVEQSGRQRFDAPSLGDFSALMEADDRFEFVPAHESVLETLDLEISESDNDSDFAKLGFFGEDRVKLKRVKFSGVMREEDSDGDEDENDLLSFSNGPSNRKLEKRTAKLLRAPGVTRPANGKKKTNGKAKTSHRSRPPSGILPRHLQKKGKKKRLR